MLIKIERLRDDINKMMETADHDKDELLKKSQELDEYIIKYIKENLKNNELSSK